MGNENTQPIKTAEEILDQMLSKQVLVKKIGQEPFNEALEAINQLLIEAKIEEEKWFQDKYESELRRTDGRAIALGISFNRVDELKQSLKEKEL